MKLPNADWKQIWTTIAEVFGAALMVWGVTLVYVPAGLIVMGGFLILLSYLVNR